jgi:dephospho-CoA kinase
MLTAAVTGDVGAGKSTLVRTWAALGANVIDADSSAKAQWSNPDVLSRAVARWGDSVSKDGAADFAEIAKKAFASEEDYRFMNSLIHPGTKADIRRKAASFRGFVVLEIPLLFETGGFDWIDYVVYVSAPDDLRGRRNAARGWDGAEIARRERFMASPDEKKAKSDLVLVNGGDIKMWEAIAREQGERLMAMAGACELTTCCGSLEDAQRIASILVRKHLAACVNISEVKSCYFWDGRICDESEWRLSCKTTERALAPAMECVRANHPYELPAITSTELSRSDIRTLSWIAESCGTETET